MQQTKQFFSKLGLPEGDLHHLPSSTKVFPDGAQYRIEIPSVEGPAALQAVVDAAAEFAVPVHRVSQGSGVMLLTDDELKEMAWIGKQNQIEVSLFTGPRATFDIYAQTAAPGGKSIGLRASGMDQVVYCIEDVKRACQSGIRGILVADEGVLWAVNECKKAGELPADLVVKVSVSMGACNPISVRLMNDLGADTYNVPTDLTLAKLSAIRQAVDIPIDLYIEVPDDFGGYIRYYEICEIIRVAAPVYVKFGLRNAPNIYPSGTHLEETAVKLSRERVRRARIGFDFIQRYHPELKISGPGAQGLGIPCPNNA
ncbi:U32 family peptidase [Cohnella silvisoli]|uniref:U32 family peptidase n=1 Tax=Cohnella silvisoli TaxID=2873699 RepID=A0ABV1KML7_9BACL|nr:U32 family peptidase [Cohnella silvisoli]